MEVEVTDAARAIVQRVEQGGRSDLVVVLGTGCCDSTAPFLYDHYLPEPGCRPVGAIDDVEILAPAWLADLYGDSKLILDVDEQTPNDSFSLESEYDCRLTLRVPGTAGAR